MPAYFEHAGLSEGSNQRETLWIIPTPSQNIVRLLPTLRKVEQVDLKEDYIEKIKRSLSSCVAQYSAR